MNVTLNRIKRIAKDIKEDNEWVNDSHTKSEYKGVCDGLDRLVGHLYECDDSNITDNWYPFKINGEIYHLEVRIDYENKSQVRVCVWDWDEEQSCIGNQVTDEWRICNENS